MPSTDDVQYVLYVSAISQSFFFKMIFYKKYCTTLCKNKTIIEYDIENQEKNDNDDLWLKEG